jgi:hypothetical protein
MPKAKARGKALAEMSEAELAEYYFAHRDVIAGEEVASRTPERMQVMISARFSPSEAADIRAAAVKAGMSVSAYLRQCALAATRTNVVDLERVRADIRAVQSKATDALQALAGDARPKRRR